MNIKIDVTELHYILDHTPTEHNIMLTGRHGIGKSEILTKYFSEKGIRVVPLFLGQMSDPGDLIGLPDREGERTTFRPPYWFPLDDEPIVLFLDEINRARPEVLQTIMDLALNRKLAGRGLPKGSRVIAAANEGENYQLTDLDPALVSRFNVFRFEPTVEDWLLWAKEVDVDRRVVSFIRENVQWLDKNPFLEEGADTGLERTPDRRAWKRVSDVIKPIEKLSNADIKLLAGIIGVRVTNLFMIKIGQVKEIEVEDFLHNFDSYKSILSAIKPHDCVVLNEDIYQYIEVGEFDDKVAEKIAESIEKYITYLSNANKNEVVASFANFFLQPRYKRAQEFMARKCRRTVAQLLAYTADIR